MFQAVSPRVNVNDIEHQQLDFWKKEDIFRKSMEERKDGPRYVFYEGPPTANGKPGSHHVLARAFKDMFPRYKTMRGYYALRKGGWDTHGLPVEIEVEKELGIKHKHEIEEYGIAAFNQKCKDSVFRYIKEWEELTERIAFWVTLDDAYVTFTNDYIQSVWWILRQFWDKELLYQGHKVVPYCPRCGTPLSSHEVNTGYKDDTDDPSVYVRFKLRDEQDSYFLAWTTTPWTLPGNMLLAVGEKLDYVRLEGPNADGQTERLIVAEALVEQVLGEHHHYKVIEKLKGKQLLGTHYEPLFSFMLVESDYAYVVAGDFVSTSEGTGIVHIAPAFGADDLSLGNQEGLTPLMTVNDEGNFVDEVAPWAGMWVKDADPKIEEDLQGRGLLLKSGRLLHTYPFCWRCDTALLYYARPTWYIATSKLKDKLTGLNQTINWVPEHIKDGRFGDWLDNNVDWALGRERYWGTPLPVWQCDKCGHQHCIGGIDELSELSGADQSELDLHRPYVDDVRWECTNCDDGGTMQRVPELIDGWFDSGAMPVAQWGYPYANEQMFKDQFPANYICEAIDQTRGWFYSLHAISTLLFERVSFENVICLGHILDADGKKMSKTIGNIVDPWDVLNQYGADAFRWYCFTAGPPGDSRRFSVDLVGDVIRTFWLTLWNTYSFFVNSANADNFDPTDVDIPLSERDPLDRWILSELHTLVRGVTVAFEDYDVPNATRPIERFVDDLSKWYVRRSRRRFWKSESDTDKAAAYLTLYECLVTVAKLLAPTMPFLSDALYRNLVTSVDNAAPSSVHLVMWPEFDEALIDENLSSEMRVVRHVVSLGHAARNNAQIKVRQPVAEVAFSVPDGNEAEIVRSYQDVIADELNTKSVSVLDQPGEVVTYALNPLPDALGPRFGADFPKVQAALRNGEAALTEQRALALMAGKVIEVSYDGKQAEVGPDEVEVRQQPATGYAIGADANYIAALKTELSEELLLEGLAREVVRRIQIMRREADFNIDDHINVSYQTGERLAEAIDAHDDYIRAETLADDIKSAVPEKDTHNGQYTLEGEEFTIGIRRV